VAHNRSVKLDKLQVLFSYAARHRASNTIDLRTVRCAQSVVWTLRLVCQYRCHVIAV